MLRYVQKTGVLFQYVRGEAGWAWNVLGTGYAGKGDGLNNPSKEDEPNVGPIPCGVWSLSFPYEDPHKGKNCFRLVPLTYRGSRRSFMIHANSKTGGTASSEGCIIMDAAVRQKLAESKENHLIVEAND